MTRPFLPEIVAIIQHKARAVQETHTLPDPVVKIVFQRDGPSDRQLFPSVKHIRAVESFAEWPHRGSTISSVAPVVA